MTSKFKVGDKVIQVNLKGVFIAIKTVTRVIGWEAWGKELGTELTPRNDIWVYTLDNDKLREVTESHIYQPTIKSLKLYQKVSDQLLANRTTETTKKLLPLDVMLDGEACPIDLVIFENIQKVFKAFSS